jgi:hypothetical protein
MSLDRATSQSIRQAILECDDAQRKSPLTRLLLFILHLFSLFRVRLVKIQSKLFKQVKGETWYIDEDGYKRSFEEDDSLKTIGDMGYSGSVSDMVLFLRRLTLVVLLQHLRW